MRIIFAILLIVLELKPAFAASYSLDQLLIIAEQNSAIKSAEFSALAQKRFANQQLYFENPQLNLGRNSEQNDYSLSQTIPFINKLQTKYNIEEAQFRIFEMRKNSLALMIKAELFGLIYQYQALKKKIDLANLRIRRLNLIDNYLSSIVLSSPTQQAQARITKDKIKLVQRDLLRLENQLYQIWRHANIYLNLDEDKPEIRTAWLDGRLIANREKLIETALDKNFTIQEQKFLLTKYHSELTYAKLEKMPDINLSLSRKIGNGAMAGQDTNGVGISLALPLFNRNQEKVLGAQSQIKAQEYELEFQKNALFNAIVAEINRFETAIKIAEIFHFSGLENKPSMTFSGKTKNNKKIAQQTELQNDTVEFNGHSHLDDYIARIVNRLNRANGDFKKGILEFITYIELDSQEYAMIDTALDNQVELAFSYGNLMLKIGEFLMPKTSD